MISGGTSAAVDSETTQIRPGIICESLDLARFPAALRSSRVWDGEHLNDKNGSIG
jgi:hypothetical protein